MKYFGGLILIALMTMGASCPKKQPPGPGPSPTPTPPPASAPLGDLRIHPQNPHYFQDVKSGKPVLIAAYENIVPTDKTFDDLKQIDSMKQRGLYYARVWHLLPWAGDNAVWPWKKLPNGKFDFNQWDEEYWRRMHQSLKAATDAGIVSELMVFDRCGMSPAERSRWGQNPWASDNNVNGMETPNSGADGTPEFYFMNNKPKMFGYQKAYVRKLIDETHKYNVIYEVENEHWEHKNHDFGDFFGIFIKDYLSVKGVHKLVSYNSLQDDVEEFYKLDSVDIVNKHFGGDAEVNPDILNQYIEPRWKHNKAINIDEFANGLDDPNILRKQLWIIIMSGGNFHIEDAHLDSKPVENTQSIIKFVKETQWDFISSHPHKNYSPGGYCMIAEGKSYACYWPTDGQKRISMPPGKYRIDWFDTHNGGVNKREEFNHSGGDKMLDAPWPMDWAIAIKKI